MKTLILDGSPHKSGETSFLIAEVCKHLSSTVEIARSYDIDISPCVDCGACKTHFGCIIQDDMQDIYQKVIDADNIIIASPVHFSNLSGSLLSLCSRFQSLFSAEYFQKISLYTKKRRGAVILTAAGDTNNNNCAYRTAKVILNTLHVYDTKTAFSLNTSKLPARDDKQAIKDAYNTAIFLNNCDR